MNDNIQHKLSQLPVVPGCYLMKDAGGAVIYVGKAKILRNRVRSYFATDISDLHPRTQMMAAQIVDLDIIAVATEEEALALEANLIKRYKPRYNVRLRDDKSYPFIKVTVKDKFPKISVVRGTAQLLDNARFFGPYPNVRAMWDVVKLVRRLFKLRLETRNSPNRRSGCPWHEEGALRKRPCIDYDIGQCSGPCANLINEEGYQAQVREALLFLDGRMLRLADDLTKDMEKASSEMKFELAARLRDKMLSLRNIHQDARVVSTKHEDMDLVASFSQSDEACITVSIVRDGRLIEQQHHFMDGVTGVSNSELISSFITQRYNGVGSPPRMLIIPQMIDDKDAMESWLSARRWARVRLIVPHRGPKFDLLAMTAENAKLYLEREQNRKGEEARKAMEAVAELGKVLNLPDGPRRIECYDISTFGGDDSVGSMVTFINGMPEKSHYRRFKINYHTGQPDDFAMMKEMLERRLGGAVMKSPKFSELADLMVIDGGKGQLGIAVRAMQELQIAVPVIGLAKRYEEVFLPGHSDGMILPANSRALHLLQNIRDEAHRFGITYHTTLRNRRMKESALDYIPGIGAKRKTALLKKFGSVEKIKALTPEELAAAPGISLELAGEILRLLGENNA
ncbi:MAG: excinuclease ABC subunit UvrC [bacterium]